MTKELSQTGWQDRGWNGLFFQLPASWQPTVIYPAYLFFAREGNPALEIKWQQIRGRFAAEKILDQIRATLTNETRLSPWDLPPDLRPLLAGYTVSGFQLQHEHNCSHGLVLFCPGCGRATLLQWYIDIVGEKETLARILESFQDHSKGQDRLWSLYDIRTRLPAEATLRSHEFLPGRYTLCFEINDTAITLYRFKPAGILLHQKNIGQFGASLLNRPPLAEGNGWASWLYRAEGLKLLLVKARRNPPWQWMRLWHEPEHNAILGVRAEGKRPIETGWLEKICESYTSLESM